MMKKTHYSLFHMKHWLLVSLFSLSSFHAVANEQASIAINEHEVTAFRSTLFAPFMERGKIAISESQISASNPPKHFPDHWNAVTLTKDQLRKGCDNQSLLPLDWNLLPHHDLLNPTAMEKCGVGYRVTGTVLAYSPIHLYGTAPSYWEDFFNVTRYPGLRALPNDARHLFEIALLADGVPKHKVYELLATNKGRERALNKYSEIKDHILWWNHITEVQAWLRDGKVVMAIAPDGPLLTGSQRERDSIGINRNEMLYRLDYLAIPRKSSAPHLGYAFISFATQTEQQLRFSRVTPSGTTLKSGWTLATERDEPYLTNTPDNLIHGIPENADFYYEYGDLLTDAFNKWRSKNSLIIKTIDTNPDESDYFEEEKPELPVEILTNNQGDSADSPQIEINVTEPQSINLLDSDGDTLYTHSSLLETTSENGSDETEADEMDKLFENNPSIEIQTIDVAPN